MLIKACLAIIGVSSAGFVWAQTDTPSSQTGSSQTPSTGTSTSKPASHQNEGTFVRIFSGGATLSVFGLSTIPKGSSTVATASNITTDYATTGASQRIGYGLTAQVAITNHIAVAVGAYLHHVGYKFDTTVTTLTQTVEGSGVVTNTSTTTAHEDTRARFFDFPLLVRYYSKGRHVAGSRWFLEAGGSWREVRSIRTSLSSTDTLGNLMCCTNTPTHPAHSNAKGVVGGAGMQFIDPFGIRVVPEVRYTRWMNDVFNSFSTHTNRNQVEATLTLAY